jgi:hypothetical protein
MTDFCFSQLCAACSVRAEAASALRDAARRLAEAEAQITQLKGDAADLQQELQARPTQQEHRCAATWVLIRIRQRQMAR